MWDAAIFGNPILRQAQRADELFKEQLARGGKLEFLHNFNDSPQSRLLGRDRGATRNKYAIGR